MLLSPLLKPKTPFFSNSTSCGGGSGRGRCGSSNTMLSSLWRRRGLCGNGGEVGRVGGLCWQSGFVVWVDL